MGSARTRESLWAVGLATLVLTSDVTAMAAALPTIETSLNTDLSTVQWVMNAYLIAFGTSIVTGGWLADRLGRRTVLMAGLAGFALFALIGGAAQSVEWLIAARAFQGLAAGLIWPAVLGLAFGSVTADRRVVAVGLMLGLAGLGEAIGPLAGGAVADAGAWRLILLAKPLLAGIALLACARGLEPETRSDGSRIDVRGVATMSVGLFALLYALDEGVSLGWGSAEIVAALIVAVVALAAFPLIERRRADPLIPRELLARREVRAAAVLMATTAPLFFVALLYVPQVLSKSVGLSPLETGAGMLPMQVTFALVAPLCGAIAARVGLKLPHASGLAVMALSAALFAVAGAATEYTALLPAMLLYGIGVGLAYPAVTALMMSAFGEARASLGAGALFMVELVIGGLASAAATTIVLSAVSGETGLEVAYGGVGALAAIGAIVAALESPGRDG